MRCYGLVGRHIDHSWSPAFFAEKFRRESITDASYDLFPLENIDSLRDLLRSRPDLCGFNVTVPYKEAIVDYLDGLDETAARIGAVNCVRVIPQESLSKEQVSLLDNTFPRQQGLYLFGYNTDASAFAESLSQDWNLPERALVFGTGGAAKAVADVLQEYKIEFCFVSRCPYGDKVISYRDLNADSVQKYRLWINATPVGMWPDVSDCLPLPYDVLNSDFYLYDLIYNPQETEFLKKGRLRGSHTKNGLAMLHRQAELSWNIFNLD